MVWGIHCDDSPCGKMIRENHPEPLLDTTSFPYWLAFQDLAYDRINNGRIQYSSKSAWMEDHHVTDKDLFLDVISWIDSRFMELSNRQSKSMIEGKS